MESEGGFDQPILPSPNNFKKDSDKDSQEEAKKKSKSKKSSKLPTTRDIKKSKKEEVRDESSTKEVIAVTSAKDLATEEKQADADNTERDDSENPDKDTGGSTININIERQEKTVNDSTEEIITVELDKVDLVLEVPLHSPAPKSYEARSDQENDLEPSIVLETETIEEQYLPEVELDEPESVVESSQNPLNEKAEKEPPIVLSNYQELVSIPRQRALREEMTTMSPAGPELPAPVQLPTKESPDSTKPVSVKTTPGNKIPTPVEVEPTISHRLDHSRINKKAWREKRRLRRLEKDYNKLRRRSDAREHQQDKKHNETLTTEQKINRDMDQYNLDQKNVINKLKEDRYAIEKLKQPVSVQLEEYPVLQVQNHLEHAEGEAPTKQTTTEHHDEVISEHRSYESTVDDFVPPQESRQTLPYPENNNPVKQETVPDLFAELPIEARQIAERLAIPQNHELQQSSWHTIEVDKQTGRAVDDPVLAYGEEFHHEQHQETRQTTKGIEDNSYERFAPSFPKASPYLSAPVFAASDGPNISQTQQSKNLVVPKPADLINTFREPRRSSSFIGDLVLVVLLLAVILAIILEI